jgi:hypothetical protein
VDIAGAVVHAAGMNVLLTGVAPGLFINLDDTTIIYFPLSAGEVMVFTVPKLREWLRARHLDVGFRRSKMACVPIVVLNGLMADGTALAIIKVCSENIHAREAFQVCYL